MNRLGIAAVEIVAILDSRTSRICREMNGRRISVRLLVSHVREVMQTPMNELTEKFAWPTPNEVKSYEGLSTDDIMSRISCRMPPYHGRCRTTYVISREVRVSKSGGGDFTGEPEAKKRTGKNPEKGKAETN
jgi:hypothetical protein